VNLMSSNLLTQDSAKTVGVNLSATAIRTALVTIDWTKDGAQVSAPLMGLSDAELVLRLADAEWAGFDAPFGWPQAMVNSVYAYTTTGCWTADDKEAFRFRRTERFLRDTVLGQTGRKMWLMSVSVDRLGLTARRMAQVRELLSETVGSRFDRSGSDQIIEISPAASMVMWGFDPAGYKTKANASYRDSERKARETLVEALEARLVGLSWAPAARDACVESDDVLDAVFAAMTARAASLGLTVEPQGEDLDLARIEGWIHLPEKESLLKLTVGAEVAVEAPASAPA
jgi:hypothetical protein